MHEQQEQNKIRSVMKFAEWSASRILIFIKIMWNTQIHNDLGFKFPSEITIINAIFAFYTRFLLFIGGCVSSLPQLAWK